MDMNYAKIQMLLITFVSIGYLLGVGYESPIVTFEEFVFWTLIGIFNLMCVLIYRNEKE